MADNTFFEYSQNIFKTLHIWCFHKTNKKNKYYKIFNWLALMICGCCFGILASLELIEAIQLDQIDVKFSKILFLCVIIVLIVKVCTVTYNEEDIIDSIKQLEKLSSTFKNKTDFRNAHKLYKNIFLVGLLAMNVSVFFFMIAPAMFLQKRKLFFQPRIMIFDMQESPFWELMLIFQSTGAFILTNITLAYDTMYCGMLCISAAALKSVAREVREIDEVTRERDHRMSEAKMKIIIEKIIQISGFTKNISNVFEMTTMVHIVYICGTMALGLYVMSIQPFSDLNCFTMLLGTLMSIFLLWIYCYFGQVLVNQRQTLQTELYFLKWYEASRNQKILIIVTISVLQKDNFVYAGKIIPLSMETFGQVLVKAYTFFTFMNDIKHK